MVKITLLPQKKQKVRSEIMATVSHMKVREQFEEIESAIEQTKWEELEQVLDMKQYGGDALEIQSFGLLRHALCQLNKHNSGAAASKRDQSKGGSDIFDQTVTMLKQHTERGDTEQPPSITLEKTKYADILF